MNIINIQRGNPYTATITIKDSAGAAYNLTGKTVFFAVKKVNDFTDTDASAVITYDMTPLVHDIPLTLGVTTLTLTAFQTTVPTGEYKADFKIYGAGVQANSETFRVIVSDIVTKRIV